MGVRRAGRFPGSRAGVPPPPPPPPPWWPAPVVLASSSPRRLDLLRLIGVEPEVRPADIDETPRPGEDPAGYVSRLARGKGTEGARPGEGVVAADTPAVIAGRIIRK